MIFINGRFLTQPLTGVQRYAHQFVQTIDRMLSSGELNAGGRELVCLVPPNCTEGPGNARAPRR